jgi:hypothetical protein
MTTIVKYGLLAAACVVSALPLTACNSSPSAKRESMEPAIVATASRKEAITGESVVVDARTVKLGQGSNVSWAVSPNVAKFKPTDTNRGLSAMFSADQPGTYVVTATAKLPDGRTVSSETNITVRGRAMTSDQNR